MLAAILLLTATVRMPPTAITTRTSIPALVPQLSAEDGRAYPHLLEANATRYRLVLGATPECYGEHACEIAYVEGSREKIQYDAGGAQIRLKDGTTARYWKPMCAAYCSDQVLVFPRGGYWYELAVRDPRFETLLRLANSMLAHH